VFKKKIWRMRGKEIKCLHNYSYPSEIPNGCLQVQNKDLKKIIVKSKNILFTKK
jgi:hypothetical protein